MARIPVPDQPKERVRNPSVVYNSYTFNGMPVNMDKFQPSADSHNEMAQALASLSGVNLSPSKQDKIDKIASKTVSKGDKGGVPGRVSSSVPSIHSKSGLSSGTRTHALCTSNPQICSLSKTDIPHIPLTHTPH